MTRFLTLDSEVGLLREKQLEAEAASLNITSGMVYLGLAVAALFFISPILEKGLDAFVKRQERR